MSNYKHLSIVVYGRWDFSPFDSPPPPGTFLQSRYFRIQQDAVQALLFLLDSNIRFLFHSPVHSSFFPAWHFFLHSSIAHSAVRIVCIFPLASSAIIKCGVLPVTVSRCFRSTLDNVGELRSITGSIQVIRSPTLTFFTVCATYSFVMIPFGSR